VLNTHGLHFFILIIIIIIIINSASQSFIGFGSHWKYTIVVAFDVTEEIAIAKYSRLHFLKSIVIIVIINSVSQSLIIFGRI